MRYGLPISIPDLRRRPDHHREVHRDASGSQAVDRAKRCPEFQCGRGTLVRGGRRQGVARVLAGQVGLSGRQTRPADHAPLAECASVASIGTDAQLVAALYAPRGDNLLAALVVLTKTGIFIKPLTAEEGSWRVDDEGDLHAEGIGPIFALATAEGSIEIALDWPGEEGHDLSLHKTSPQGVLEEVLTGYLYTAPQ